MDCSMKHKQSIFNDVPKSKGYDKCKDLEKMLADGIYSEMCHAQRDMTFNLPVGATGANVIKAMMVKYFPYTYIDKHWYTVKKFDDGTRDLIVNAKIFRKYMERNVAVFQKIGDIINELHIGTYTDEKVAVVRIANYLTEHVKYDWDDVNGYQAYDALIKGSTICTGYSEAFKALCDYCGIKCNCLEGDGHMWNRVYLNGKWKFVDTTWLATGSDQDLYLLTDAKTFYSQHMKADKVVKKYWEYKG